MTELEQVTEAEQAARQALRDRKDEVAAEARQAAYVAERKVKDEHEPELDRLYQSWRAAEAARVAYLDSTVSHPLEGRRVIRQWKAGRSWSPKVMTERGIIKVRRADTVLPYDLKSYQRPEVGHAYIQNIRADGSEGVKVDKLYDKMKTEAEWRASPPFDGMKGHWLLDDSAEGQSTKS